MNVSLAPSIPAYYGNFPRTVPAAIGSVADLAGVELGSIRLLSHGHRTGPTTVVGTGSVVGAEGGYASQVDARQALQTLTKGDANAAGVVQLGERYYGVGLEAYSYRSPTRHDDEAVVTHGYKPAHFEGLPSKWFGVVDVAFDGLKLVVDGAVEYGAATS
ncbi:MAG: hypothetical protein JWO69_766 [Thermoleophilia bacterium]|nr:hypothetical protein [Thermoleophilia bacterium]